MILFLRVQFDFPNALAMDSDNAVKWGHVSRAVWSTLLSMGASGLGCFFV